jgi:hypothetical protein
MHINRAARERDHRARRDPRVNRHLGLPSCEGSKPHLSRPTDQCDSEMAC